MTIGELIEKLKQFDSNMPVALKAGVGIDWWYFETRFVTTTKNLGIPLRQIIDPEKGVVTDFVVVE